MDITALVNIYDQAPAFWFILWGIWTIVTLIIAWRAKRSGGIRILLVGSCNALPWFAYSTLLGIAYYASLAPQVH